MPDIRPVELSRALRLLNHGPVTLVSSAHGHRRNVMAASWVTPLDFTPPKVTAVIDARTFSRELIEASGEFALNIPCRAQAAQTLAVGEASGRDQDKFTTFGLETFAAGKIAAPLIAGCIAWLECRVIQEVDNEKKHDLFIAEIVAAWADARDFEKGRWHFTNEAQQTLHYVAGGTFFATGEMFEVERLPV